MTGQPTRGTKVNITEQSDSKMVAQRSPYNQMAMGAVFIAGGVCVMVTAYRHSSIVAMLVCLALAMFGVYEILTAKRVTLVADTVVGHGVGRLAFAAGLRRAVGRHRRRRPHHLP